MRQRYTYESRDHEFLTLEGDIYDRNGTISVGKFSVRVGRVDITVELDKHQYRLLEQEFSDLYEEDKADNFGLMDHRSPSEESA